MKSTCNALSGLALLSGIAKIFSLEEERLQAGFFLCLFLDKDLPKVGKNTLLRLRGNKGLSAPQCPVVPGDYKWSLGLHFISLSLVSRLLVLGVVSCPPVLVTFLGVTSTV